MSDPMNEEFRTRHSTINEEGKRNWIYALQPKGKLYQYRTWLSYVYLILFVTLPFIRIDGNPMFQFNLLEGEFTFFGVLFTPQDFIMFGIGMLIFILFIIIFIGYSFSYDIKRMSFIISGTPNLLVTKHQKLPGLTNLVIHMGNCIMFSACFIAP